MIGSPLQSKASTQRIYPSYIYPVAEGGVQLEWSFTPQFVSLEIDFGQKYGEWHAINLSTDVEESESLNLNEAEAWKWVANRLASMVGASEHD